MSGLDLSFLLESGLYNDIHIACTGESGREHTFKLHRAIVFGQCPRLREMALDAPVAFDEELRVDVVDLEIEPTIFEGVLRYLYLGEYEAVYQAAEVEFDQDDVDDALTDDAHSMFYSLRVCQLACDLNLAELFTESSRALYAAARFSTDNVDFAHVVMDLYDNLRADPRFDYTLAEIPQIIAETSMRDARFKHRFEKVMRICPEVAIDVVKATMDSLAAAQQELRRRDERPSPMLGRSSPGEESDDEPQVRRRRRRSDDSDEESKEERGRPVKRRRLS
ncbi:hypothetical protein CMUS01_06337 [Colletotrichum musicola]|uniref:BTB domain-containing protein n=1 Tax=Colletotrichum musicola TaxID=2175873 RepID=A0A8H6KMU4_9PEZI|nr:hypothetical protein CMUS01_06337 [Colletotrichum musicola]